MSPVRFALDPRAVELLREARDWRLISLLFERPRDEWWAEVAKLSLGCVDVELLRAAELASSATEGDYLEWLGPAGIVSPREAGYRKTTDPARLLAEVHAYYAAFAYQPRAEDPPDHVAVEAGFLGWLCLKEAYARADENSESASVTRDAKRDFIALHLACVAHGVARRFEATEGCHLAHAARALVARAGPLCKALEGDWVPNGLAADGCSLTCGTGDSADAELGDEIPPEFLAGLPDSELQ
ncbi:MAG: molecular chaperone TorD family protein [Planctomycetes bacterium]|nr:molecular chaperone TorD family protein [Planctomycetota bacterium]